LFLIKASSYRKYLLFYHSTMPYR